MRSAAFAIVILIGLSAPASGGWDEAYAAYNQGDYATALNEFRSLAEAGSSTAQTHLGFMYEKGQGVSLDYAEAVKWYRKAAAQGNEIAQDRTGCPEFISERQLCDQYRKSARRISAVGG